MYWLISEVLQARKLQIGLETYAAPSTRYTQRAYVYKTNEITYVVARASGEWSKVDKFDEKGEREGDERERERVGRRWI